MNHRISSEGPKAIVSTLVGLLGEQLREVADLLRRYERAQLALRDMSAGKDGDLTDLQNIDSVLQILADSSELSMALAHQLPSGLTVGVQELRDVIRLESFDQLLESASTSVTRRSTDGTNKEIELF